MAAFGDLVRFNPTLGGTTDWIYSTIVAGCQSPSSAGLANGVKYKVYAVSNDLTQWEVSEGAYSSSTTTFPRTTVLYNSSATGTATGQSGAGTKINFSTVPQVAVVGLAEDLLSIEVANSFTATQRAQARANTGAAINDLQNVTFAVSASAGALTIALKDAAGNDATANTPITLSFRNASLSASPNIQTVLEVQAAASVVIPSTSTLGIASATGCRVWIIGWNDGGTFRLGVFNASNANVIFPLIESVVASSLQVVAAGNVSGQHYTAGAAVANKAFRILGYVDWNASGMTAGTWTTTNLNSIVTFGPGIARPGTSTGNIAQTNGTTQVTSTSSTVTASNLTVPITPTSAANLIKVKYTTTVQCSNLVASAAHTQLMRGAVAIGALSSQDPSATAGSYFGVDGFHMDQPNSTSTQTYKVGFRNGDNASTVKLPGDGSSTSGNITAEEIMG